MRHKQVWQTVASHIRGVDAHTRLDVPFIVIRSAGDHRNILEAARACIEEQKVGAQVVGYIEVDVSVVIHVAGDHALAPAILAGNAKLSSDVDKGPVPARMEKAMSFRVEQLGTAVNADIPLHVAAQVRFMP